jgi:GNAT superfamily N-acetyltransferase
MEKIKIRRWCEMEDFNSFFPMLKDMLKHAYGSEEKGLRIYRERYDAVNYYRNYRARPNSFLLVAENEKGKPVGFLYARRRRNDTYLYDIYVKPEYRGKGIGRALVEKLRELAGGPIVTDTHSGAKPFFERLGFRSVKTYEEDGVVWHTMVG